MFFLDDMDIFTMVRNLKKRSDLIEQKVVMHQKVIVSRATLKRLKKTQYFYIIQPVVQDRIGV